MLAVRSSDPALDGGQDLRLLDERPAQVLDDVRVQAVAGRLGERDVEGGVEPHPFAGVIAALEGLDCVPQPSQVLLVASLGGEPGSLHLQEQAELVKLRE